MKSRRMALLIICFAALLASCAAPPQGVVGYLDSFEIDRNDKDLLQHLNWYEAERYFYMSKSTWNDVTAHPEKYSVCWVESTITNQTSHPICSVETKLARHDKNIWLDSSSLSECSPLDMAKGETYEGVVCFVMKCDGLSDEELGKRLKDVRLEISYSNHSFDEDNWSFLLCMIRRSVVIEFAESGSQSE